MAGTSRRLLAPPCVALLVIVLVACSDREREPQPPASSTAAAPDSGTAPANLRTPSAPALTPSDHDFAKTAASGATFEVEASRLALHKTQDPAVRTFAQRVLDEHTRIGEQLRTIVRAAGVADMLAMNAAHSTDFERLGRLEGRDFDREYAAQVGIAVHQQAVRLYDQASREITDAQLKSFAEETMPQLRERLQEGRALARQVGVSPERLKLANAANESSVSDEERKRAGRATTPPPGG